MKKQRAGDFFPSASLRLVRFGVSGWLDGMVMIGETTAKSDFGRTGDEEGINHSVSFRLHARYCGASICCLCFQAAVWGRRDVGESQG